MVLLERHVVNNIDGQQRFIDYCIGIFPPFSTRNSVKKALKRGRLTLNGEPAYTGLWVQNGDEIKCFDLQHQLPKEYPMNIEIVYEDDYFAIVNKPPGIVVSGNLHRTLENAMVHKLKQSNQIDALKWAKPVHRLDAATSGLVILAKTSEAHRKLSKLFEYKMIQKKYRSIVQGKIASQTIRGDIDGKAAVSIVRAIRAEVSLQNDFLTLIELHPITGRTHQLRKHCLSINAPIVGDKQYGIEGNIMRHKGLFLAAVYLGFRHPFEERDIEISIAQPPKFNALLDREARRWKKYNSSNL